MKVIGKKYIILIYYNTKNEEYDFEKSPHSETSLVSDLRMQS